MINVFKDIQPSHTSIRPFKLYKTYNLTNLNVGTGSNDILIFDAINDVSSSSEVSDLYRSPSNPFIKDNSGYILDFNYKLLNGETYMPVSESLNPNGSVKRLIYKSLKRLFYDTNRVYYLTNFNSKTNGTILKEKAFLFYIPSKYISESISPQSFTLIDNSDINNLPYENINPEGIKIKDIYGDGFIYDTNNSNITSPVGNISYETGHIIITDISYRNYFVENLMPITSNSNFNINFSSYYTTTEHEYVCVVGADEFNISNNPTLYDISNDENQYGSIKSQLIQEPWFRTYITQIGLYDDAGKLVVVGKLATPLKKETNLDSILIIKFDI